MLSDAASKEDMSEGIAGYSSIIKLFTVEDLRNTTRANPLVCLGGCVEIAMADPAGPPLPPCSGPVTMMPLELRYRTTAPAPAEEPRNSAAPAPPLAAAVAGKENAAPQKLPGGGVFTAKGIAKPKPKPKWKSMVLW